MLKYAYKQWQFKHGIFALGFDPDEWGEVRIDFLACIQHGVFDLGVSLSSFMFHIYLDSQPFTENTSEAKAE